MTKLDRSLGCLTGLAIGDALGAPVEFSLMGEFEPVSGYRSGGPFNLKAGQWTDDTSQAICLAKVLLGRGKVDSTAFANKMLAWYRHGVDSSTGYCFDIGIGTQEALDYFSVTGTIRNSIRSGGNGCLMRLAPVPIFYRKDLKQAKKAAIESALVTHGDECALQATELMSSLLVSLIQEGGLPPVNWTEYPLIEEELRGDYEGTTKVEKHHNVSGFSVNTLGAALHCLTTTGNFRDCVLKAVNLGGDTDTVGAVAGQLAGALYGWSSIPRDWLQGLQDIDMLSELAVRLHFRYNSVNPL